jgi:hypothetical protein
VKNWRKIPFLSAVAALEEIDRISRAIAVESDARLRMQLVRRLAFAGCSVAFADDAAIELPTIRAAVAALHRARRAGATNEDLRRSLVLLQRLEATRLGLGDPETLAERRRTACVGSGCLAAAGRPLLADDTWLWREAEVVARIND